MQSRLRPAVVVVLSGALLAACGSGTFAGSSGQAGAPPAPAAPSSGDATAKAATANGNISENAGTTPSTPAPSVAKSETPVGAAAAQSAAANLVPASQVLSGFGQNATPIGNCLANLGITQLPPDASDNFQVISDQEMSPFANETVTDPDDTVQAGEVYIRLVNMSGFGPVVDFNMQLLNPAGIYCITTSSFSVFTSSNITMCKTGKIASTQANDTDLFNSGNVLKVGCD